jgi:hypothetical protein
MALGMAGMPKEKMGNATSILSLMRNIGGSVGIAIMTTFLARRNQIYQNPVGGNITAGNLKTGAGLRGMRGWRDGRMEGWFHTNGADQ